MDTRNDGHWDSLAEHLGADVKPEQPTPSKSVEPPPQANIPISRQTHPAKSRPEPRSTDWSQLASSLGLTPAEPQQPVSFESATTRSEERADESSRVDISHGEAFVEEIEVIDLFADDEPSGDETISTTETRESETSEDNEDRPGNRRRRRRRGRRGRSNRRADHSDASLDHSEQNPDDEPAESADEKALTSGESTIKKEERKGRRRRRRRDGRDKRPVESNASEDPAPDTIDSGLTKLEADPEALDIESDFESDRSNQRGIPSWEYAVGHIIDLNMEQRAKSPKTNGTRGQHSRRGPRRGSRRRGKPNDRPSD